jgi:hypothetical protein
MLPIHSRILARFIALPLEDPMAKTSDKHSSKHPAGKSHKKVETKGKGKEHAMSASSKNPSQPQQGPAKM